jgi:hypothetical protein
MFLTFGFITARSTFQGSPAPANNVLSQISTNSRSKGHLPKDSIVPRSREWHTEPVRIIRTRSYDAIHPPVPRIGLCTYFHQGSRATSWKTSVLLLLQRPLLDRNIRRGSRKPGRSHVDTNLGHHFYCFRSNCRGAGTGRINFEPIIGFIPQDSLSDLGSGRILSEEIELVSFAYNFPSS